MLGPVSYAVICVPSCFANILLGKREMVDLLLMSSGCHVVIPCLFPTVPWVSLQCVNVSFPGHTHFFACRQSSELMTYER